LQANFGIWEGIFSNLYTLCGFWRNFEENGANFLKTDFYQKILGSIILLNQSQTVCASWLCDSIYKFVWPFFDRRDKALPLPEHRSKAVGNHLWRAEMAVMIEVNRVG
jgi:hypothetical protein